MVDAVDMKDVERFIDIFRRAFLAGVGGEFQAHHAGAREHVAELRRRMTDFRRIEADTEQFADIGLGHFQAVESRFFRQVTQEGMDD